MSEDKDANRKLTIGDLAAKIAADSHLQSHTKVLGQMDSIAKAANQLASNSGLKAAIEALNNNKITMQDTVLNQKGTIAQAMQRMVEMGEIKPMPLSVVHDFKLPELDMSHLKVVAEENKLRRKGIQAQVDSVKLLEEQQEVMTIMSQALTELLNHNVKQAELLAAETAKREELESKRYSKSTQLGFIAAIAGVLSVLIAAASVFLQIYLAK